MSEDEPKIEPGRFTIELNRETLDVYEDAKEGLILPPGATVLFRHRKRGGIFYSVKSKTPDVVRPISPSSDSDPDFDIDEFKIANEEGAVGALKIDEFGPRRTNREVVLKITVKRLKRCPR
jgi:hypothetical protein